MKRQTTDYALRGIDVALWRRVKAQAAYDGQSIRSVLLDFLKAYADHGSRALGRHELQPPTRDGAAK